MQKVLVKVDTTPMNPFIENFIENLLTINELDYGDFMRKANHHLLKLEDKVAATADPMAVALLADIKLHLQYNPNWNINQTKQFVLNKVANVNNHI